MDIRTDDLGNGFVIDQDPAAFCFGTDAVLLASFAAEKKYHSAADLGSGNGIIPILLASYDSHACIWGVEIQPEAAALFRRSVEKNSLEHRVRVVEGDLRDSACLPQGRVDLVTANPPYFAEAAGKAAEGARGIARSECLTETGAFLTAASSLLQTGGRFCMIQRTERLAEIMAAMRDVRLEPKRLRLIYPKIGRSPSLFLAEARKDASVGLCVDPPFFLYDQNGMTDEFLRVYRGFGMKKEVPEP